MASYKKTVHTDKAFALIGKMVAGNISELEFTKIKVSDKDYSKHTEEELKKLTTLEQIKQETLVSEKTPVGDNAVNIHGIIYNTDLQSSYYLRTIGVYANDPDEGEILYSVTATQVGDYIPTPNGNNITTAIIDILTEISDAEVNLSGNPSALVDVSMLNKKLNRGEGLEKEFDSAVKIVTELKKKQNKEDSALKTVVKTIVGAINELFDNKLEKGGYTGTAQNLLTETSKITSKSVLGRIIIGKGLSVDSSGRTSIVSKNDGITVNENDIQINTVDNVTTDSGTKPLSARQGKKLEENKQDKNDSTLLTTAKNIVGAINELFSGKANKAHSHGNSEITDIDASKIKTGIIDISRLPQAALERCVVVADDTARFKLTKSQVQVGDSVKVTSPDNLMYIVVDDNKLNVEAGYIAYAAAVKWDTIKDKPSTFPPSSHTHDDRYYTENEINTKLNGKANSSHTHTKNQITDFPSSLKNPNALTIQANEASLGSYDGSAAKTFNITASNIGASPSNHSHTAGQVGAYTKGEIDEKLKNFCPIRVGDIYITTNSTNPSSIFLNTTWQKIEGRFLFGTSGNIASKQTGGSNSKIISQVNLPNVKLKIDSFSVSRGTMNITGSHGGHAFKTGNPTSSAIGCFVGSSEGLGGAGQDGNVGVYRTYFDASKNWTGSSTSTAVSTSSLGNGTALDITPVYYTCHIWLRLS